MNTNIQKYGKNVNLTTQSDLIEEQTDRNKAKERE